MGDLTNDFSRWEVRCPCGCGSDDISMPLIWRAQIMRDHLERAIIVTSGVRCQGYNDTLPDSELDSEHVPIGGLPGEGLDLKVVGSGERGQLLSVAVPIFKRIGIDEEFIHVGIRASKPQNVIWLY